MRNYFEQFPRPVQQQQQQAYVAEPQQQTRQYQPQPQQVITHNCHRLFRLSRNDITKKVKLLCRRF